MAGRHAEKGSASFMKLVEIAEREFADLDRLLVARDYVAYRDKCIALGIGPSSDDILLVPRDGDTQNKEAPLS
jgi:hypothetical protein